MAGYRINSKGKIAYLILPILIALSINNYIYPQEKDTPKKEGISDSSPFGFDIHGFLSTRYRIRFTDDDSDNDIYQYLQLNLGNPEKDKVSAHLFARATADLDGDQDTNGAYVFDSIQDTFGSSINARLYYAYLDIHKTDLELLRLGRQYIQETPEVLNFDGLRLDLKECKSFYNLQFGAYGGVPVHLFESTPDGDAIAGAFTQAKLWQGNKVRLDYTYLRDKNFWGEYDSNLYGVSAWQTLYQYLQFYGQYTLLGGNSRDFTGRGTYYNPDLDLQFQASFYSLIKRQNDYAIDFDPFYAVVKEYSPYWQWRFSLYKGFGENFAVMAGADTRQLTDDDDEAMFNREFTRFFLTPIIKNIPYKGMDISITGEIWDSEGRDTKSAGLDITHQCTDNLKVSVGTSYSLYKYDYYADTERDDVRDYYLKLNYKLTKDTKLSFSYAFEDDDFDYYHELQFGVKYEF